NIQIITNADEPIPFVNADIGLIERALENLIENAVRHTPADGEIRLQMTPSADVIKMQISDNGPGIPEDFLPLVFKRFHQLDKSRKVDPGHTGLGLAITKKILDLHGSSIEVSSNVGSGTSFSFQLPVDP
ncbi:MAG: ATP-binding protein, partial [Deltaproteobacteria bacterium]|nr:ATP-binding protein [Deltaproteobacteria bacterium]